MQRQENKIRTESGGFSMDDSEYLALRTNISHIVDEPYSLWRKISSISKNTREVTSASFSTPQFRRHRWGLDKFLECHSDDDKHLYELVQHIEHTKANDYTWDMEKIKIMLSLWHSRNLSSPSCTMWEMPVFKTRYSLSSIITSPFLKTYLILLSQ